MKKKWKKGKPAIQAFQAKKEKQHTCATVAGNQFCPKCARKVCQHAVIRTKVQKTLFTINKNLSMDITLYSNDRLIDCSL